MGERQNSEAFEAAVEGVEEEDGAAEQAENVQAVNDDPGHHEAPPPEKQGRNILTSSRKNFSGNIVKPF
jgi:hypothetical protein